jgi:hypothetical protein
MCLINLIHGKYKIKTIKKLKIVYVSNQDEGGIRIQAAKISYHDFRELYSFNDHVCFRKNLLN